MEDKLIMSKKERQRKAILDQVIAGFIHRKDARKRLGIGDRQLKRIIARYKKEGDAGLIHKSRGKPSGRAYSATIRKTVIDVYREKYLDFGPTLAAEKLTEEDQRAVHPETLRLWLKSEGLWLPHRKRKVHRKQRTRRARYGELLQLDGSIHAWLAGVDGKPCLMNMVDDATGKTLALLDSGETTRAAFALLRWWITEAGIPLAIYVDLKSLYVSPKTLKRENEADFVEPEWLTHFSKACEKLGIEIIKAYSPQAKGRVERSHGVYQDRFVKELKLKGIMTIEGANDLLSNGFVNQLNQKFAKAPADSLDAHVALLPENDLDQILCWEFTRQVKRDWTIQFDHIHYQIEKSAGVQPKQKIIVRRHLDDSVSLWYKDRRLKCQRIKTPSVKVVTEVKKERDLPAYSERSRKNKHKTPWGQFNPGWLKTSQRMGNPGARLPTGSTSLPEN